MSNNSEFRNKIAAVIKESNSSDDAVFSDILLVLNDYCKNKVAGATPEEQPISSIWGQLTTHLEEANTILNMVEDGVFDNH